ncbi:MAG: hypothetical protein CL951_06155 [Erythrobacteraceae bacterium]|nr:hypothetical protein [Erythrobacteraceae bacterium]
MHHPCVDLSPRESPNPSSAEPAALYGRPIYDRDVPTSLRRPRLYSDGLIAKQLHWVNRTVPTEPFRAAVKTRYRQQDIPCLVTPIGDDQVKVTFDEPQKAVTPGQSAVFYQDEVCLGGGIIESYLR